MILVIFGLQQHNVMPRLFEFGRDYLMNVPRRDRKGDERGRHVDMFERSAHRVLASDRGNAQIGLRLKRAEKRGKRLPPTFGIVTGL